MLVGECMTTDPVVAPAGEPVGRVAMNMQRLGIHQMPVVDEANRLVGIVTDRDIRSAVGYGDSHKELELLAEDVMSADVVTVSPRTPLIEAVSIVCRRRFGSLPVVDHGTLVGIITRHDMLRKLHDLLSGESNHESRRPVARGTPSPPVS